MVTASAKPVAFDVIVEPGLPPAVVKLATALFTGGIVVGPRVEVDGIELCFQCEADGHVVITATPKYGQEADSCLPRIYEVIVGFQRSGFGTTTNGAQSALLPGQGRLESSTSSVGFQIEPIFQDHLPPGRRFESLSAAHLQSIDDGLVEGVLLAETMEDPGFRMLFPMLEPAAGRPNCNYALHQSGILVELFTKEGRLSAYRVQGRHPPSNGAHFVESEFAARPARTWGEAWAAYSSGGRWRPSGLNIIPDEICVAINGRLRRFQIQDRRTLENLDEITFGPGISRLHGAESWLAMADEFAEAGRPMLAWSCAEQAMLCSSSDEEKTGALDAMETYRANRPEPARSTHFRVEPVSALLHRLGPQHAGGIRALSNAIMQAHIDRHDQKRASVGPLLPYHFENRVLLTYRYEPLTIEEALQTGMSPDVLGQLGYPGQAAQPDMLLDDVFTARLGPHRILGNAETGSLVLLADPLVVYVCG